MEIILNSVVVVCSSTQPFRGELEQRQFGTGAKVTFGLKGRDLGEQVAIQVGTV